MASLDANYKKIISYLHRINICGERCIDHFLLFRCVQFLEEMFGCETSLDDIILSALLADMTTTCRVDNKRTGGEESRSNCASRVPRLHCDKAYQGKEDD